jgi:hypothetical protein
VPQAGQHEPDNPAPVLELKPAAAGATPISPSASTVPSTLPSASPPSSSPASDEPSPVADEATQSSDGAKGIGVVAAIVGAAVIALAGAVLWVKRRGGGTEA